MYIFTTAHAHIIPQLQLDQEILKIGFPSTVAGEKVLPPKIGQNEIQIVAFSLIIILPCSFSVNFSLPSS